MPSLTPKTGKAKRIPVGRSTGRKPGRVSANTASHRKTDITLPPAHIDATKAAAQNLGVSYFEWQRLAVHAYARELVERPIVPRATMCEACRRPFQAPRNQGTYKRLRVSVYFDDDCIALMDWMAANFYHGVWSQAFEAACTFMLGPDAPKPAKGARA